MNYLITEYLQADSKALGSVLSKLNQLQQWNHWLKECLEKDSLLPLHCFIVNLIGTSLIVLADNPHWVTRFRFHIPTLLPKLKNYPDFTMIQSICCKVEPNYTPVSFQEHRDPQKKLSAENADLMREAAKKISDEKLQVVLNNIADRS